MFSTKRRYLTVFICCLVCLGVLMNIFPVSAADTTFKSPDYADDAGHMFNYNYVIVPYDGHYAYSAIYNTWSNLKTWDYDFGLDTIYVDKIEMRARARYAGIGWGKMICYVKYPNGSDSQKVTHSDFLTTSWAKYTVTINIGGYLDVDDNNCRFYYKFSQGALNSVQIEFVKVKVYYET